MEKPNGERVKIMQRPRQNRIKLMLVKMITSYLGHLAAIPGLIGTREPCGLPERGPLVFLIHFAFDSWRANQLHEASVGVQVSQAPRACELNRRRMQNVVAPKVDRLSQPCDSLVKISMVTVTLSGLYSPRVVVQIVVP